MATAETSSENSLFLLVLSVIPIPSIYLSIYIYVDIHIYIYMYIYMYVCMHVCMYITLKPFMVIV